MYKCAQGKLLRGKLCAEMIWQLVIGWSRMKNKANLIFLIQAISKHESNQTPYVFLAVFPHFVRVLLGSTSVEHVAKGCWTTDKHRCTGGAKNIATKMNSTYTYARAPYTM